MSTFGHFRAFTFQHEIEREAKDTKQSFLNVLCEYDSAAVGKITVNLGTTVRTVFVCLCVTTCCIFSSVCCAIIEKNKEL